MANLVHEILDKTAEQLPEKIAIITDEQSITYAQLASDSKRLAAWCYNRGIRYGDRISIILPNDIATVTLLFAASRIGAIFFILSPQIQPYHLHYILQDSSPSLIVTTAKRDDLDKLATYGQVLLLEEGWKEVINNNLPFPSFYSVSSDPISLIYTSGSTGMPKAVISSHYNVIFASHAICQCLQIQQTDVIGNFLPLSFDYGLYQIYLSFLVGATLALGSNIHVGPCLLTKLKEWKVTGLPLVPNIASTLIRLGKRLPHLLPQLRFITNTGSHLPQNIIDEIRLLLPECLIYVMFGLTECKRVSILQPSEYERKFTSVGKPLPDTQCLIVNSEGQVLPPGQIGELVVRGSHVMLGYWHAPELTAKRFRNWGPGLERVLFTGDFCSMDEDGYLYFYGRTDDIYKHCGYRVSTLEVESAAYDIPGINEAALILLGDLKNPILFITSEHSVEKVFNELQQRLEEYKLPINIFKVDNMPRNSNGKIDKEQLKKYAKVQGVIS